METPRLESGISGGSARTTLLVVLLVVGVVAGALGIVSLWPRPASPMRMAFVGGLTGRAADLGVDGRNGAMLAVEQRNAQGGVHKTPVELLVRDDEQSPEKARAVAEELRAARVDVVVGPMTSSVCMAMLPVLNEAPFPTVSPTVTTEMVSGKDDNLFRVCSSTKGNATKDAEYHFRVLNLRNAVAILDVGNKEYTQSWIDSYRMEFERLGGKIVQTASFESGKDVSFKPIVDQLLGHGPDLFLIVSNVVDAVHICNQIRASDAGIRIGLAEWASTERLMELGGAVVEGAYVSQYVDRESPLPRYQAFSRQFKQRFGGNPGFAAVAAYDSAMVAMVAMETRRPDETLKAAILRIRSFEGLQETITFDEFGDSFRTLHISIVENGRFRIMR